MGNWLPSSGHKLDDNCSEPDRFPAGVTEISRNWLYEFYRPVDGEPLIDIIFFHGLQPRTYVDAYWKTWTNSENNIWPQTFLGTDFPQCRVLSLSYDSCVRKAARGGRFDTSLIMDNLIQDILIDNLANVGNRPVILVGHSVGGLVIKMFLLRVDLLLKADLKRKREGDEAEEDDDASIRTQKLSKFLDENLVGIFYYGTPHSATGIAKYVKGNGPVITFLRVVSNEEPRLSYNFKDWRRKRMIPVSTIAEGLPTSRWGIVGEVIVEEGSIMEDTDHLYTVGTDHFGVCKPLTMTASTYQFLSEFIQIRLREP